VTGTAEHDRVDPAGFSAVARNSMSVAFWVLVSRVTGFARIATIAAVLGPTYLGNTFQAINQLPNLIIYDLLMGSLFVSLLVPSLVRHVDARDPRGVERVAGAFLGMVTLAFLAVAIVGIVAGPLLLRLFALGVRDPSAALAQQRVGWLLLVVLMPQVLLYGVATTAIAVMNAHGRFVLASAAPALENLGVIATMVVYGALFRTGTSVERVTVGQVLVLGVGATAAVALHAAAQWWGARRLGVRLLPRAGWRDTEVRQLVGRAVPSLGYAGVRSLRLFAVLVVANSVPGGVIAFQLALNFLALPLAVGARPVGVALLPELARLHVERRLHQLRHEVVRAMALAHFLIVPAAVAYLVLAGQLAHAVSFGEMAAASGVALTTAALVGLAPSVVGDARFDVALQASYARHDARSPFYSQALCTAIAVAGMLVVFTLPPGALVLLGLGLAVSVSSLVAGWHLSHRLMRRLPEGRERATPGVLRAFAGAALMAGPVYLATRVVPTSSGGHLSSLAGLLAAGLVGIAVYAAVQLLWRSPELRTLLGAVRTRAQMARGAPC
jgi:putative peptidoglycan lipid II flippase